MSSFIHSSHYIIPQFFQLSFQWSIQGELNTCQVLTAVVGTGAWFSKDPGRQSSQPHEAQGNLRERMVNKILVSSK